MQRWLYGSVADGVLHSTTTPLLLLRPTEGMTAAFGEVDRLVVPLDGSALAEAALPVTEELSRALGVPIARTPA